MVTKVWRLVACLDGWGVVLLVAALGLTACGAGTPTLPPTPAGEGFAIYLTQPEITPAELAMLSHLELEAEPFLSINDIVAYSKADHLIELTREGFEKVRNLNPRVWGRAFAVCVDGSPIYAGAFWPAYSSMSYDGVVIDPILASPDLRVIAIQLGYPGEGFFRGEDPRGDPRVFEALQRAGKLQ